MMQMRKVKCDLNGHTNCQITNQGKLENSYVVYLLPQKI